MNSKPNFSNLPKPSNVVKANEAMNLLKSEDSLPQNLVRSIYGNSPYLSHLANTETAFLKEICAKGFEVCFEKLLKAVNDIPANTPVKQLSSLLRKYKRQASLLIAIADISRNWLLEQITNSLTSFADAAVKKAVEHLFLEKFEKKFISSSAPEGFYIVAVGKQGSYELNYSSDIDIVVIYDDEDNNYIGKLSPKEFYVRLTQELVEIIQSRTGDGYVFRTDLRLRPDPYSTPLAVSVQSAEKYYKTVGQNWERAAMIKARFVAGDEQAANKYLEFLSHYIWRKNLDFKALEDVRSIKRQIDAKEGYRPESLLGYNIKLGKGGIREIEFFAQTQQLIWGGREESLRLKGTCDALKALAENGKIQFAVCSELIEAYEFYRTIEHRLQMVADEHTHSLPKTEEELKSFATFMGYDDADTFKAELLYNLSIVQTHYAKLFDESPNLSVGGNLVFTGVANDPETLITIGKMGFKDTERVCEIIRGWHHGRRPSTRYKRVREILTECVPHILQSFANSSNPDEAFVKFDDFLGQIPNGVLLFSLFEEKPEFIDLIAEIMGNSPWLAANLSRSAALVNHILITDYSKSLPSEKEYIDEIKKQLSEKESEDKIHEIRRFKHDKEFQVGIRLLKNKITHLEAAQHLSAIAEIICSEIMDILNDDKSNHIAIVAMGKMGMRELTFGSDLDLVFVYDSKDSEALSHNTKLVNKFIQTMSQLSNDGMLYNVDTRLRPMGEKGSIASSIDTYEQYYHESAWNWELMALTKARLIYGEAKVRNKIEKIIKAALSGPQDSKLLAKEMHEMRQKIAETHSDKDIWNVKYAKGGLFEAEFYIQHKILTEGASAIDKIDKKFMDNFEFLKDVQSAIRLTSGSEDFEEAEASENQKRVMTGSLGLKSFEELKLKLSEAQKHINLEYSKVFINS